MNDFENDFFGKGKNPFESMIKLSASLERITSPFLKTQSLIDTALKSQMDLIGQTSLRNQAFYSAFEPATVAFAKLQENSLVRMLEEMEKSNALHRASLINSISDVIGRIEVPSSLGLSSSILKQMDFLNNDLSRQFRNLAATDFFKNLQAIPELNVPSHWETKSFEEIIEEVVETDSGVEKNNNLIPFLVLLIAGVTGLDLSDLKNPEKKKIVRAQIFHFLLFLAIAQFNKESIERTDYCVAARGCVVRVGPGYKSERLTAVPKDYTFRILEESQDWYKVQFIDPALGFREGWVKKSVTSNKNANQNSILFSELQF